MFSFSRIYYAVYRILHSTIWKRRISAFGNKSLIYKPLKVDGNNIFIGSHVQIQYRCWLASMPLTGEKESRLEIGDGCVIGHYNEIYATKSIVLEPEVLTADRVYISDNLHGYTNPDIPVLEQPIRQNGTVRIGEGSWLGVGVCVMGANIGRHCVIGANAVVTHDIPDYSVAVGIPAKVIKRFDPISKEWRPTNSDGSFKTNQRL